jgi:hypothetical protein
MSFFCNLARGPLQRFSIQQDIYLFVVKARHAGNGDTVWCRISVVPNHIRILDAIDNNVIVVGVAFIWALGHQSAPAEDSLVNATGWDIVPRRQARFVKVHGETGLGNCGAVKADFYFAGRGENVYPFEGVFRVDIDRDILFKPLI